jgi:hypothetical protein
VPRPRTLDIAIRDGPFSSSGQIVQNPTSQTIGSSHRAVGHAGGARNRVVALAIPEQQRAVRAAGSGAVQWRLDPAALGFPEPPACTG